MVRMIDVRYGYDEGTAPIGIGRYVANAHLNCGEDVDKYYIDEQGILRNGNRADGEVTFKKYDWVATGDWKRLKYGEDTSVRPSNLVKERSAHVWLCSYPGVTVREYYDNCRIISSDSSGWQVGWTHYGVSVGGIKVVSPSGKPMKWRDGESRGGRNKWLKTVVARELAWWRKYDEGNIKEKHAMFMKLDLTISVMLKYFFPKMGMSANLSWWRYGERREEWLMRALFNAAQISMRRQGRLYPYTLLWGALEIEVKESFWLPECTGGWENRIHLDLIMRKKSDWFEEQHSEAFERYINRKWCDGQILEMSHDDVWGTGNMK